MDGSQQRHLDHGDQRCDGIGQWNRRFQAAQRTPSPRARTGDLGGRGVAGHRHATRGGVHAVDLADHAILTAGAGSGSSAVTVATGCSWATTSNASWITVTSGMTGSGNGAVSFNVAVNNGGIEPHRHADDRRLGLTVTQGAASCSAAISATSQAFSRIGRERQQHGHGGYGMPVDGGEQRLLDHRDQWRVRSGDGTVAFSVAANTDASSRSGTLTIAGTTFNVSQAALTCTAAVSPTTQLFSSAPNYGGNAGHSISRMHWTAVSNTNWITVTSGASGSGNGSVVFNVALNNSPTERTGSLTIAGTTSHRQPARVQRDLHAPDLARDSIIHVPGQVTAASASAHPLAASGLLSAACHGSP